MLEVSLGGTANSCNPEIIDICCSLMLSVYLGIFLLTYMHIL